VQADVGHKHASKQCAERAGQCFLKVVSMVCSEKQEQNTQQNYIKDKERK
jgi:hypothetical protein